MKHASKLSDIPKEPHYQLVYMEKTFIPGDERSQTNPGHGYGERTQEDFKIMYSTDIKEVRDEVAEMIESKREFVVYHVDSVSRPEIRHIVDLGEGF